MPPVPGGVFIPPGSDPMGFWSFDDCNPARTNLRDDNPAGPGNGAFRSVGVTCTSGVQNSQAVAITVKEDIVYVPDQPDFTFEQGVTVAGWFNPTALSGTRTLFRKRDAGTSSFALLLNGGKFQLVIGFGPGRAVSLTSPKRATAGVFQHVAATYDGATARLYVDGLEVNSFAVPGTIPVGPGPLLMGNDGSERRFAGAIDSAMFATHALTAEQVLGLTCVPSQPVVTFSSIPETQPGQSTAFDIAFTNNNDATCPALTFSVRASSLDGALGIDPTFGTSDPVASGTTGHFTLNLTPSDSADPGRRLSFFVQTAEPASRFSSFDFFDLVVAEPDQTGCAVRTSRELMITSTTVVDDPVRTVFTAGSTDLRNGVWTFKHLAEEMAPTPADAPAMIEAVMSSILVNQTINQFPVPGRSGMQKFLADWPRTTDGRLDLARAPLRLQAIVNRFDLRNLANGDAGEGRLVFALESGGSPLEATMIFEYKLPAATDSDVLAWASAFHGLGALPFGEDYNAALQTVTQRFVSRGARPGHPNGNAISTVRTNEISFGGIWELREFRLSAASGLLEPSTIDLTPDLGFDGRATLASYINANQAAIIAETHSVPRVFEGLPFQAGAVFNNLLTWKVPGVDPEARHHFALNTCNGCHSSEETGTPFLQISPRTRGTEARLSGFLTGVTIGDPVNGVSRTFNDLRRRNTDLKAIVCADSTARAAAGTTLRKGISRVH